MGIIWKKCLSLCPISIDSDRICGVQIIISDCTLSILCVYLPSTDHDIDEYKLYLNELESAINALQSVGPVIVAGDFNAHLPALGSNTNTQGRLLNDLIDRNSLFAVSCSNITTGPNYTYLSDQTATTVDYILVNTELVSYVNSCEILTPDPLNLSDHLLSICVNNINIYIYTQNILILDQNPPRLTGLAKARKDGLYTSKVQSEIIPLLHTTLLSISEVEMEIKIVVEILTHAASEYLPHIKPKKKKKFIIDSDLKVLFKQSKAAWIRWKNTGRPNDGVLWSEMKESKRAVKKHITACRARKERADIQKRDLLFKDRSNHRFRVMK